MHLNASVLKQFVHVDCFQNIIYSLHFLPAEKHCAQRPQAGKHGAEQTVRGNLFTHQSLSQSAGL